MCGHYVLSCYHMCTCVSPCCYQDSINCTSPSESPLCCPSVIAPALFPSSIPPCTHCPAVHLSFCSFQNVVSVASSLCELWSWLSSHCSALKIQPQYLCHLPSLCIAYPAVVAGCVSLHLLRDVSPGLGSSR